MKIGIIGMGMVGEAVAFGLNRIGHGVFGYDIDLSKSKAHWSEVLQTELTFVCVPTPLSLNGACNTDIVWRVVTQLNTSGYEGLIVIKSTVPPGTTNALGETFSEMKLAFCPEFLRERARFSDFYENHEICIAGVCRYSFGLNSYHADLIKEAHGNIPKYFKVMSTTEAELAKYFVNCFNAYRINFANAFFDVCQAAGADYKTIKDAVTQRHDTRSSYLEANEQFRAFGACVEAGGWQHRGDAD